MSCLELILAMDEYAKYEKGMPEGLTECSPKDLRERLDYAKSQLPANVPRTSTGLETLRQMYKEYVDFNLCPAVVIEEIPE